MRNLTLNPVLAIIVCCVTVAVSGCASILGPYAALESEVAVEDDRLDPLAVNDDEVNSGTPSVTPEPAVYKPEFSPSQPAGMARIPADQTESALISESSNERPAAFGAAKQQPGITDQTKVEENPFALMAREQMQQTSFDDQRTVESFASYAAARNNGATAVTFHEATPRLPTAQPCCPVPANVTIGATQLVQAYPDEYIFDGGDRDHPVHYYGGKMEGLDTEDTVAEFKDHEGGNHIKASNRVAVYAPRFGSVETISGPKMDIKVDQAIGARNTSGADTLNEDRGPDVAVTDDGPVRLDSRRSASGVELVQQPHRSKKIESIVEARKIHQGMQARSNSGPGLLQTSDQFELTIRIQEPITQKSKTGFGLSAATSQPTLTYSTYRVAATVGTEEGGRKGQIHLTKEASPLVAKPGDTITFRIDFQNVGDYNVNSVRIIDNLTPRLTYVDGSGKIEVGDGLGGDLTVVPNKEGSQTLIFELDAALTGGASGFITFEAEVR